MKKKDNVHLPFSTGFSWQTYPVSVVALAPNGKQVAFGGWDETVQVCDIEENGKRFSYYGHTDSASALTWSLDSRSLASASHGTIASDIQVWDAATGTVHSTYAERVIALGWSADGSRIRCGLSNGMIQELDATNGSLIAFYSNRLLRKVSTLALTWTHNMRYIAWGSDDRKVIVSDILEEKTFVCRGPSDPVELVGQKLFG